MARAVAYMKTGNADKLNSAISYSGGVEAAASGRYSEALEHYEKTIRLDPGAPWPANNLAWVLATCPDEKLRDGRRAIEFARRAIQVPKVEVPMLYRVQVEAVGIREADIETDFIKEASNIKDTIRKTGFAADVDQTAAAWESEETRIEVVYSRSKSEAVMEFLSKRFEQLSAPQPAERQNS